MIQMPVIAYISSAPTRYHWSMTRDQNQKIENTKLMKGVEGPGMWHLVDSQRLIQLTAGDKITRVKSP
jgi:hypothetical protein